VSTGTTITATYCDGVRQCRGKELKQGEKGNVEPATPLPIPIPPEQQQGQPQAKASTQPQPRRDLTFPPEYPAIQHEYDTPQVEYPSQQ
jgi:hypothetical protein